MAFSEELADRIRELLEHRVELTERKMFGGIAFMLKGNMCVGVMNDDLLVRVGREAMDELMKGPYVKPMDFTGRTMSGFILVEPQATDDDASLEEWVERGASFADSLPPKKKK